MKKDITVDVAIVGAGPSGLFSVLEAGVFGLTTCLIDSHPIVGGQCSILYPEKPIYDIPAHKSIIARDFIRMLYDQVATYKPHLLLDNIVERVEFYDSSKSEEGCSTYTDDNTHDQTLTRSTYICDTNSEITSHNQCVSNICHGMSQQFRITTKKNVTIIAKAIIIATGGGNFVPKRPDLHNIDAYEGHSVFYSIQDKNIFAGKHIVIAGGGDAAIDWSLSLSEVAQKIYLVHRRNKFRCVPDTLQKVQSIANNSGKIEFVTPYKLHEVIADENCNKSNKLKQIVISNVDTGAEKILPADILLPCFGLVNYLGAITTWGVGFSEVEQGIYVDYATMSTNVCGIYAIGDVALYKGKMKSILSGLYEAAKACRSIYTLLNPSNSITQHCREKNTQYTVQ